jgi:hypothetical protein
MMLYVNGSDIARLVLGVLKNDRSAFVVDPAAIASSPETCLKNVDAFLASHAEPLEGIVAVIGPGSATALRTSLTIVNTIGFTKGIPLYGVELVPGADDRAVLVDLHHAPVQPMLRPAYTNAAKITPSAKDALGRAR